MVVGPAAERVDAALQIARSEWITRRPPDERLHAAR